MERCIKHPKYDGKKKPKHECVECLELYLSMPHVRAPIRPTKTFKDKSKYSRSKKFKKKLTDFDSDSDPN
jgi:hypothetical protein